MIKNIDISTLWSGESAKKTTWFHPKVTVCPGADGDEAVMICQPIYSGGGDLFGPVHWSSSKDGGTSWRNPEPIPGLSRQVLQDDIEKGVCDVVPEYHPRSKSILAAGTTVFYKDGKLFVDHPSMNLQRGIEYTVRTPEGTWLEPRTLRWKGSEAYYTYSCGCSQRVQLETGEVLIPVTFAISGRRDRSVSSLLCSFDGQNLDVLEMGRELSLPIERGLLEPSITLFKGKYFMTIRAEDGKGYVSSSIDGLNWGQQQPWTWDDGEPLIMSTTQQHWLNRKDELYLVYTRKTDDNIHLNRWRAPLFIARVEVKSLHLLRNTEKVVVPMASQIIDGQKIERRVGNFHITYFSEQESWITATESLPLGRTLLARIKWK